MDCLICKAINAKSITVYEDDKVSVLLLSKSFTLGHLKVVPKNHYSILEQVPDDILTYMTIVANRFASILFETMGLHGTNILIQNGVTAGQTISHFSIDVVPRKSGDNLDFKWDMNKASHESLEGMKNIYIDALENKDNFEEIGSKKEEPEVEEPIKNGNNALISHLKHIP